MLFCCCSNLARAANSLKLELIENNSYLLEEKQELEYKLNKTSEVSHQQIRDLEESVEQFNDEVKAVKGIQYQNLILLKIILSISRLLFF